MKQFKFNERQRFSIRKFSIGAASVLLGSVFFAVSSVEDVQAAEQSQNVVSVNDNKQTPNPPIQSNSSTTGVSTKEANTSVSAANVENKPEGDVVGSSKETQESVPVVSTISDSNERKLALSKLIEEIDGKFTNGKYASKTEESVNQLKAILEEARSVLSNATTESELTQAHSKLVTATTQLKTKQAEKKEAPEVDTTNGKSTVGTKATNTEKTSESNSIANSGSRDERNGKVVDTNNPFRTDAATTDTDPAANQTYTAPAADANLETLSNELKNLPNFIENNKKIQDMDTLGNALNVKKGSVNEIHEFGGWKAVGDSGKFAIARKTEAGVFPIETVNTVWADSTKSYVTWVLEQSFNRDSDYMLFLSKVRTKASSKEEAYDNSTYVSTGLGDKIAKGVKGFDGIQKTFKAYSKEHGSKVIVKFKTGYTGDINGTKAQYKVEVIINRNGQEEKLYDQTFTPEVSKTNSEMNVVKASDGTNRPQNFSTLGTPTPKKEELEAKIASNKPNGTGGTFTSKEITLPEGVTEYTVRISSADNMHLGMGYQSPYRHYALPVTGLDFNIDQDTGAIAKDLLSRIYDKLKATETADTDGKTNETKAAYLAELENIKTLVTSTDVKKTAEYKVALESILSKQLALKVDKTGLTDSKASLDDLVKEDPTPGKTKDTATAYNAKKQDAIKAIEAAKTVIDSESATVAQVREALATVNAKKEALQQAKDGLIEAATAEEKAKLKADADSLVKADTTGKTPKSIEAYNTKYEAIKAQLEAAKTEAAAVLAKENNASKAEVKEAQTKVDAAKAELTKAAELLVNKADKTELTQAKEALSTLATEADPTTGKTADSAKAYNDAKTDAQEAIKTAETVINDENATPEQVTAALNKVNEKKTALQQAKAGLIEAATVEEKAKLKSDADLLTKADETGKTPDSIAVYERKYEELKDQLEVAKAEADKVLAKGNNATKEEVKAAQAKVDAVKTELETAKNILVEAATTEEKTKLKTDSDALKKADTTGKTADSIKAYGAEFEKLKAQLEETKAEADKVLAKGNNATKEEVKAAQEKVDAVKTELENAKKLLVEAATTEEKTKLKADTDSLVKADTTGKTPNSISAYNTKYEALKAQLEAAKAEAKKVLAKENNASKAEAQAAQTKVDAAKAELTKAAELLVNKADKTELTKAKEALSTLVSKEDPTTGKTSDSAKSYNDAKTAAEEAIKAAETVINDENATQDQVTEALNKVNEKKAALEAAKQALVEAATAEEKAKLKADADSLVKADETGKTPESIAAYERKYEELKTQLEAAKEEAKKVLEKGNNATKEEVKAAQAKVDAVKTELTKAAELLVNKADKAELTKAKEALNTLATEADPTTGKTADSAKTYNDAKTAAQEAIQAAETVINDENATPEKVMEALNKVNEKKAALEAAKQALVEAATAEEKAKLKADSEALKKADTTGKTADSIKAYEAEYEKLKAQLEEAKAAAAAVAAKGDNATKAEAQEAQAKVDAVKQALEKAAELLKDLDKDAAKKEIADAAKKATDAIEASTSLTDEQKAEEKAKVAKAAKDATDAIDNATTEEGINSAKENGKLAIEKEAAITAINAEKAAKEQEIDNNSKLSDEEKVAAKAEVAKASTKAVEAITKAATQDAVDAAKVNGEAAIKAVNPVGKEKALEAIQTVSEAKLAEIDKNTSLSSEEKKVAKAEVAKAAIKAVEAIQKSETQEAVNDAQAKGEAAIKAVNPIGKEKAKAAVEAAAAEKIASIRANPNLSAEEKAKEIAEVERLKQEALNAIDKATTKAELEKALRTFLYQMDQESLVYERPSFDLEAFIQSSITGVVTVERGKAISQADVISKLNLPENVTVISIELPDTNTLGDKFAKVILRLADGTEITVKVPVRVVASQSGESKPETSFPDYGINNGTTNTDAKVDKAKLEGAIHQLDELIIKESAKLDAETAKEANDLLADAKKVFANADASQAEVDAMVKRIEDFMAKVAPATDHATPANDQAAQTSAVAPATTQAATDASQIASAQANTRKVAKELPNTGTADSVVSMLAAATSAVLGLGLAGRRRKEDEEA